MASRVVLKKSTIPNAGLGVFAYDPHVCADCIVFKRGDVVTVYGGRVVPKLSDLRIIKGNDYILMVTRTHFIDGHPSELKRKIQRKSCERHYLGSYINSYRGTGRLSNCKMMSVARKKDGLINIVATRTIRNNEELLMSYGSNRSSPLGYSITFEYGL